MKPYGYVYKIVCKVNGKLYIGQTIRSISERWRSHCNDAKKRRDIYKLPISRAIYKYGPENFSIEVICIANNQAELNTREKTAIRLYKSTIRGYNVHEGGMNQRLSASTKEKISRANKGKVRTKEQRENYRNARLGTKQPMSVKIKCSNSQLGEKSAWFGKKHSEETKTKIGNAHRGKIVTKQQKEKQRISMTGRKLSEDTKTKMSIVRKGKTKKGKSVLCIENGKIYLSIREAARMLNISLNSITHFLRGKLKTAQGFTFKYI